MTNPQIQSGVIESQDTSAISDVVVNSVNTSNQAIQDDSVFSLFWNAGFMIKLVMLSLLFASIWSWAIIIQKHMKMKKLNMEADIFEDSFWSGTPLDSLYREIKESSFDPFSNVFCAAMAEWERFTKKGRSKSYSTEQKVNAVMRIRQIMSVTITKETDLLERSMTFLSSLGTNGVIVGIFGTVLGIMGGMKAIALQQSMSMATVAPIISEALFTTAMGLVAAIPAAIAYNKISSDIDRYVNRLETFAEEFSSIVSRQFDEN